MSWFERTLQAVLWQARWIMLIPVLGLLVAGVYFAVQTSFEVLAAITAPDIGMALAKAIGAVDLALLAAVLVIFALGIYELFIGEIRFPDNTLANVLVVKSLSDLKSKLGQVILMILVVKFFEKAQTFKPEASLDYLFFAAGVAFLALALWLVKGPGEK